MDIRAGLYARISRDAEGSGLGVDRQTEDCEREAARRGWTIADRYTDNDLSAYSGKARPEYERLFRDVAAGRIDALVVWDVDRLTRTPRELEDVIDHADRHGLQLANVGGEVDLATPQGRLTARIKGSVARHEAEQMSRRLRRKFDENAQQGRPHGLVAYGYRRVEGRDVIDPEQAAVIRATADGLLRGESLRSIVAALNATGEQTPRGTPWSSTTLRQVMLRDRNAGLRRHRGHVIGKGDWEPIYSEDRHARVVALLTDPNRRTNKGAARRHLLSGIALCGRCGGTMRVNSARQTAKAQPVSYQCSQCLRVRRKQDPVDALVTAVIVARLQHPDVLEALARGIPAEVEHARDKIAALEARLSEAADQFADGLITGDQLARITGKLRPQIEAEQAAAAAHVPLEGVAAVAGPDAERLWDAASLSVKRAVIETLCSITIEPTGSGGRFDPDSVRVEWRS